MKQPSQKKRRPFLLRVPVLLTIAVGASVALVASREDGRDKLAQAGEFLGKSAEVVGTLFSNAQRLASDYIEQIQQRDAIKPSAPSPYQPLYPNETAPRQSEYSHTH